MGKGGGCVPSKKTNPLSLPGEPRRSVGNQAISEDAGDVLCGSVSATEGGTSIAITQLKIFIVFYSMYGHVRDLARRMKRGVDSVEGVEGLLFQVPETLPGKVLDQMKAPSKDDDIPVISAGELPEADGFLFGFPTRFGCMAAQMKTFFDSTGQLWKGQKLSGKPAGFFVSTGTQGGGQETTVLTAITQLAHHGMLFVPIGYTFGASMFRMDSIRGGSPYGSGAFSGDGSRGPAESELALAEYQGNYMAEVVKKLSTRQATHD